MDEDYQFDIAFEELDITQSCRDDIYLIKNNEADGDKLSLKPEDARQRIWHGHYSVDTLQTIHT